MYRGILVVTLVYAVNLCFYLVYGGDDGARTRDLCRDTRCPDRFFNDLQTREERRNHHKSGKKQVFVGWVVGWKPA